jgi:hypothetical protein
MKLKKIVFDNVDWIHLAQGRAGHHEYGNRLLVFIKGAESLDQLSDINFSRLWFHALFTYMIYLIKYMITMILILMI